MQLPLQIAFRELAPSEALENLIRKKAKKLDQFHSRIMSCHVVVEKLPKHHRHGREFQIHIDVRVPGAEEIVSTLQHHEDVYVALRDAFDSVARQIEDVIRQQRGDVKTHETPQYGAIVRLLPADGCGFIEATDGRQIYFSRENVVQPPFEHLRIGMHVRFLAEPADEGWQAKRVSVGKHGDVDTALAEGAQ